MEPDVPVSAGATSAFLQDGPLDQRPRIAVRGEFDVYTAPRLREALAALDGPAVIDLTEVRYLDSAALHELIVFHKRVGGRSKLVVGSPHIRRILEIARFDQVFEVHDES